MLKSIQHQNQYLDMMQYTLLLEAADIYLKIMFIGVIPTFAYNALTNILRGMGDSKTPTYILIVAALLNIVLDILFIKAFGMGVAGAAFATVLSQLLSFIVCMVYMKIHYRNLFINVLHLQFDKAELKKSLKIGTPAMIQQVFVSVGFMSLQFLINGFGTDCMAAYTAASKVDAFAEMPALNLGQAMTNFTAQNLGAKRKDRVLKGGKYALVMGIAVSACISVVIVLFPSVFISIFNRDTSVLDIGNSYLKIVPAFYIIFAAMQVLNGLLLGYGKSFVPMIASICSLCCLQVPVAIILSGTKLGYSMLSVKYRTEQQQLDETVKTISARLEETKEETDDAKRWIDLIQKYSAIDELTAPLLNELIEKIVVHQSWKDGNGRTVRDIEIYYRFVGKID